MGTIDKWDTRRIVTAVRRIALAVGIVSVCIDGAHATMVTPSDLVVHSVTVRAEPTTQSAIVGKLVPGAQAEKLGSVTNWVQVKLDDGTVGYVSRAWVTEIEAAPTSTPTAGAAPTPTSQGAPTSTASSISSTAPVPLLATGQAVPWWFVFKFNAAVFPECGGATRQCPFGGTPQAYSSPYGQQFVYASSSAPTLQQGSGCLGDSDADPVGATFDEVYNGAFHYVVWNDQFYDHPPMSGPGCQATYCDAPWGHS
ncbi:MAG: SH3 domain-containing protein, partial [Mycobacteriales bacterium]